MSHKRSIQAIDKRISRWRGLCEQFPKSESYRTQLTRLINQRTKAAEFIGKPKPTNASH